MKEICIPFTNIADEEMAEIEVRIPGTGKSWRYRIEPLRVDHVPDDDSIQQYEISRLQTYIGSYNHNWELIQIIGRNYKTGNIQMLYREKQLP
jgi:hypothetical protein